MDYTKYLIEKVNIKNIKPGSVFGIKGKEYPQYVVNRIVGDNVEYTYHSPTGSDQKTMKLTMFTRIKDLEQVK